MRELTGVDARAIGDAVLRSTEPMVLRGLIADWPAVRAGLDSAQAASAYLRRFCRDATVGAWRGPPEIEGRFFYNADMSGFNYQPMRVPLQIGRAHV